MPNLDDFRGEDGKVDWAAYDAAQLDNGDRCYRCRDFILNLRNAGYRQLCHSCKGMDKDPGEARHDDRLRCPKCKHQWSASYENEEGSLYEAGLQDSPAGVYCPECEYQFEVQVHVSWSYTSPPILEPKEDEDD